MKKETKETIVAVSILVFCLFADAIWEWLEINFLR